MKKIALSLLCLGLLSISVLAQPGLTRPRVVEKDTLPNNQNNLPDQTPNPPAQTNPPASNPDAGKSQPGPTPNTKPSATPIPDDKNIGVDDGEVIKVETNLVTLPVTVSDRNGRFIGGLKQEDFKVFEDGVEQKVEYFASLEQPFTVVLLIDVSSSTSFKIEEIQDAAIAFVNQLGRDDRIEVISFDENIHILSPPTSNRAQLTAAIRQLKFGGGTSIYEAVDQTINRELAQIKGRKAIVLYTDGVDTTSRRATYRSTLGDVEELDAMIYPIRFDTYSDMNGKVNTNSGQRILMVGNTSGSNGSSPGDYEKGKRYLDDLANTSGGRKFEASTTANLEAAFSGIADELRRQYSIGYYPETEGKPGQRKQINVRTNKTNVIVRSKNSYVVSENAGK